ncbi:hypothetical protein SI65_04741 [Aspergillus cristatus]|uniref:AB hydrolase-1 domain-containing protein n=1 Tax=Aspergillus cristatus TaxID=573508 RepID=A0A1E3BFJ5_ASPCR|nr:hypothetical protein SI65_04741 [Aspergillus cristatus]
MATVQRHPLHSLGPIHPPKVDKSAIKPSVARKINIRVKDPLDHAAPAILHEPHKYSVDDANASAVVLVSGAGGGVSGPAGIYPSLADKLTLLLSIPCIRLDYRLAADTDHCTADIIASLNYLSQHYKSANFVIVGWSFGGSPCFTAAAEEPNRIRGVATIASQTARTAGVKVLAPRPLLLLHGLGDSVLGSECSEALYRMYGDESENGGEREIKLFEGGDHGLSGLGPEVEGLLLGFIGRVLGFEGVVGEPETRGVAGEDFAGGQGERVREMEEGRDLEGEVLA